VRVAIVEVLHLSGVEVDVSSADPDALDVNDDPTGCGLWRIDLVDTGFVRSRNDEGSHLAPAHR
jgi:hypothetical protein